MAIAILIILVLLVVAFIALLTHEQNDKEWRQKNGLPPKKYHDITDMDVTIVHSIHHHDD